MVAKMPGCYSRERAGQYIATMPPMQKTIPISDSMFGKNSEIHAGV